MRSKGSYRSRLFINIFLVLVVAILVITLFQYHREKEYRRSLVENTLRTVGETVSRYLRNNHLLEAGRFHLLDSLGRILPAHNIRITVIDREGKVLYDNFVKEYEKMENHLRRPEVQKALKEGEGADIRRSATTGQKFFYLAHDYGDYLVRTAMVYDISLVRFLRTDHLFIYFTLMMFLATAGILVYMTDRLGKSISRLKDFAVRAGHGEAVKTDIPFPNNEVGTIGRQIVQIYENLRRTKEQLSAEREKLYRHLQAIGEGVAFFSPDRKMQLVNHHFIRYVNILTESTEVTAEMFITRKAPAPLRRCVEHTLDAGESPSNGELTLSASGRYFRIQCIAFPDGSFEVLINDVTEQEKSRLIKQQMISNLAHELRTPVTSALGYLETLRQGDLDETTRAHFIKRAYKQIYRLSALLRDIAVLNKMGEAADLFEVRKIKVWKVVRQVIESLQMRLEEKNIAVEVGLNRDVILEGNRELVFSIFQNLLENTILHAGEGVKVTISHYLEDEHYYYFSYADTGPGIPEVHQARVFERFYRVDKSRSRKEGGTGLGLSIVKNAVQFHQGEITVRNRAGGGVEFLFTLAKKRGKT